MWGGARLRACAEGVRWTKGEVPGRFSRVRHFVAVAIGNGLGKTAREARSCWSRLLRVTARATAGY